MRVIKITPVLFMLIIHFPLSGCQSSGDEPGDNTTNNQPSGQFDLVSYLFSEAISVTPSSLNYPVTFYDKSMGMQVFQYNEEYARQSDDTIVWSIDGEPSSTFVITATTIDETVHSANDEFRINQRYVDIDTEYLNDTTDSLLGAQNATCKVVSHHPSIDLATLTGSFPLAAGIYNDVLEINCVTGFIIENNIVPHTDLTHYFARDVGLVLTEGSMLFLGEVYVIPQ